MKHWLLLLGLTAALAIAAPLQDAAAQDAPGPLPRVNTPPAALTSAAPNPFSDRTQFSLTVPSTQNVTIDVFNLLGQRVRTIYTGIVRAGEPRTFTFEAGSLPSGIYLYRAQGERFVATRRVLLVN